MLKKCICFLTCISIMFLCLPVFSSAATPDIYSNLPEPVPTDNCKYFVIQIGSATHLYMISALGPIDVRIGIENNIVTVHVFNQGTNDFYVQSTATRTAYNVKNGALSSRSSDISSGVYKFSNFPVNSSTVKLYSYGCVLDPSFNLPSVIVAWNDSVDPSTYTTILNNINSKLNEIDTNTDGLESALADINSELTLFYNLFNSYQSEILGDTSTIISQLNTLNSRLNTFANQNHTDLTAILSVLNQIYALLSQEQETRPPAIENEAEVNDVLQNEAALNRDFSGDLNQQFDVAGNIFDSNSSFSFISNLFQELVLDVPALNSLIIFSLAIGLCVLILGRRLNA